MTTQRKVLIVQRRMTHYRVPFFNLLKEELNARDIKLTVAFGDGTINEASKNDAGHLSWGQHISNLYLFKGRFCWQSIRRLSQEHDLVVVTHENKLASNLPLQFLYRKFRVVLWGHGANFQGKKNSLSERLKRFTARKADWWLAYTNHSVPLIMDCGFPLERITTLNNSIDALDLADKIAKSGMAEQTRTRNDHGLMGNNIGLYLGSLYSEKRLDFLLQAAERIRATIPDFELLIVGDGPQRQEIAAFCAKTPWASYAGALSGQQKANALAISKVMLNPGLVGLGILDSFVSGTPMITTDCGLHSPEIAYLESGSNGLMTPNTVEEFAKMAVEVFKSPNLRQHLKSGCLESAQRYSLNNMATNFASGIVRCLESPAFRHKQ